MFKIDETGLITKGRGVESLWCLETDYREGFRYLTSGGDPLFDRFNIQSGINKRNGTPNVMVK